MSQAARRKRSKKKPAGKPKGGASWGMLVIGLVSGSILAALILGSQEGDEHGFGSGLKTLIQPISSDVTGPDVIKKPVTEEQPPKPKLDFYTVLPKIERVISDPVAPEKEVRVTQEEADVSYVFQVAAYENFNEADRLKAQLTITGFDATVQKVTIEDKGVYYRVRLGPYKSKRKLEEVEQKLLAHGVRGISLRVSDH